MAFFAVFFFLSYEAVFSVISPSLCGSFPLVGGSSFLSILGNHPKETFVETILGSNMPITHKLDSTKNFKFFFDFELGAMNANDLKQIILSPNPMTDITPDLHIQSDCNRY